MGVDVDRTVRGRDGTLLGLDRVRHVDELRNKPVLRMDVEAPSAAERPRGQLTTNRAAVRVACIRRAV